MAQIRSVLWDDQFEQESAAIQPDIRRLDEARRYLEWELARRPEVGIPTEYPGVLIAPLRLPRSDNVVVPASVFYTYDADTVWVMSVRLSPG